MILKLAVDQEQNPGNQRTDSRDDASYDSTKAYTKKTQAGNDQKDPEQNPFQLTHIHFFSFDLTLTWWFKFREIDIYRYQP